jgi:large repetitive protein
MVAGVAAVTALAGVVTAVPAGATGTPPQISLVTGHNGTATVTVGHPKVATSADISPTYIAYDSANGDEAVAQTVAGSTHVYLIAGAADASEYGLTGPLVKGDAYLIAGNGTSGLVQDPGGSGTGGSASAKATTNPIAPTSLAFDSNGNLLIGGLTGSGSTVESAIQVVAKGAGTYYGDTMVAGDLYSIAGEGGLFDTFPSNAIAFPVGVDAYGMVVDSSGNIIVSTAGEALFLNETSSTITRYGKSLPADEATSIAGTSSGTTTCGSGSVSAASGTVALGKSRPFVDASGNVYLNDDKTTAGKGCTWVLPAASGTLDGKTVTAGNLYSLTGAATTTAATSGAVANTVSFPSTTAVAVDPAGNVVAALAGTTPSLRVIAESTGTYYDQSMTKGDVYTISGGTSTTLPGNAAGYKLAGPTSLVDGAVGDLLLTDGAAVTTGTAYEVTGGPTPPAATPTVTSVTPSSGVIAGGTTVTIHGRNLGGATAVTFGAAAVERIASDLPTAITVVTSSHVAGKVTVSVTTPRGKATLTTGFTYVLPPPTLASVTPPTGSTKGGTTVAITGTNLTGATAVTFGGTAATAFDVVNSTTVTAKTKAHIAGSVIVSVTTPGGTAPKTGAFAYVVGTAPSAPTITSVVRPSSGTATLTVGGTVAVSWTAPITDGGFAVTKYEVTAAPGGQTCTTSGTLTCTVSGLTDGVVYGFTVAAANEAGTTASTAVQLAPGTAPAAPGTPTAQRANGSVTVRWVAATSTASGFPVTKYTVTSTPTGKSCTWTGTLTTRTFKCTVPGLTDGTSYVFLVKATNAVGTGPTSEPSNAAVPGEAAPPGSPMGVVAIAGNGKATVSWTAPVTTGGLSITDYTVTSTPTGKTCTTTGSLTCTVTGLTNGTAYTFTVEATNAFGSGPTSSPSRVVIPIASSSPAATSPTTAAPPTQGYWEVASDGGLFAFGTAQFYGSEGGQPLNAPIVGMTATPTGKGYWEVASDGGLFAFGTAQFYGSEGGQTLAAPIVGMVGGPTGKGYWEVASDGGLFAFGTAQFYGSMGGKPLNAPIVGIAGGPGTGGS